MCEIMTIIAALVFTAIYFCGAKNKAVFNTMLMFWGAALMWGVDCVVSVIEGGQFFTLDREDTILGVIIIAAGLFFFVASYLRARISR